MEREAWIPIGVFVFAAAMTWLETSVLVDRLVRWLIARLRAPRTPAGSDIAPPDAPRDAAPAERCVCGQPWTDAVHRTDGPCYWPGNPAID